MAPLLELGASEARHTSSAAARMCDRFSLSEEERETLLPSGKQTLILNRTHWAVTYLVKAGLMERPKRGHFRTTDLGRSVLANPPPKIDVAFLQRYEGLREFTSAGAHPKPSGAAEETPSSEVTPQETIEGAVRRFNATLRSDLAERVAVLTPLAFEQLIVDLMTAMGYGAGGESRRIGKSGDGGVDGVISEDKLGLDVVYLQAKRYAVENKIDPGQIREFIGTRHIRRASKGVFVTTSSFTAAAETEAMQAGQRLVLIDGERLADLMIRHDVGVRVVQTLHLKEVDLNFFEDA